MRTRGRRITHCPRAGVQVCCPAGASEEKLAGKKFQNTNFLKKNFYKFFPKKFSQKNFSRKNLLKILKIFFLFFVNKNFPPKTNFKKCIPQKIFNHIF